MYLLFQKPAPKPTGNFQASPQMQKLSKEALVFVQLTVDKKPSDELKQVMKRCKVTRLPMAVITDEYGNPLCVDASTTDPNKFTEQIKGAKAAQVKLYAALDSRYSKTLTQTSFSSLIARPLE